MRPARALLTSLGDEAKVWPFQTGWTALKESDLAGLKALIAEEVDAALVLAGKLTVGSIVSRKQIKDTAAVFASDVEFGPGLPELVGEIARRIHRLMQREAANLDYWDGEP